MKDFDPDKEMDEIQKRLRERAGNVQLSNPAPHKKLIEPF